MENKLFWMTADNTSNNLTMARELEDQIATFKEAYHMLGCTGHFFNYASQVGLKALGHKITETVVHSVISIEN